MNRMVTAAKQKNIQPELKAFIAHSIREILDDPDFGLELTETAKRRLRAAKSKKQKWISHTDVKKKLY